MIKKWNLNQCMVYTQIVPVCINRYKYSINLFAYIKSLSAKQIVDRKIVVSQK